MPTLTNSFKFYLLSLLFFPAFTYGADPAHTYKVYDKARKPYLKICTTAGCTKTNLPNTENSSNLYFETPSFTLHDLDNDGIPELIITEESSNGAVNVGSTLFRINKNGKFEQIIDNNKKNTGHYLYNITFHDGKIISSYRNAASWFEEVYSYISGKLILEMQDKNSFERTIFDKNGKVIEKIILVENDKNWWERKPQFAKVTSDKAWLYNSPDANDQSKMYLIKDNRILLRDYKRSEDEDIWYCLVEYTTNNNKKIVKWIKEKEFEKEE